MYPTVNESELMFDEDISFPPWRPSFDSPPSPEGRAQARSDDLAWEAVMEKRIDRQRIEFTKRTSFALESRQVKTRCSSLASS